MEININGKTINIPEGRNIQITRDSIIVDGKNVESYEVTKIEITINGDVERLDCNGSVKVSGNVLGNIDCNGSVAVSGDVSGSINCNGSCTCGKVMGSIDAGGSVICR